MDDGIVVPFPTASFTPHDNVRSEVILKRDEVIVHLFPRDPTPRSLNRLAKVCFDILTQRFPLVHGAYETIISPLVPPSGCIRMPRHELTQEDLDYFQDEFPREVAGKLARQALEP